MKSERFVFNPNILDPNQIPFGRKEVEHKLPSTLTISLFSSTKFSITSFVFNPNLFHHPPIPFERKESNKFLRREIICNVLFNEDES